MRGMMMPLPKPPQTPPHNKKDGDRDDHDHPPRRRGSSTSTSGGGGGGGGRRRKRRGAFGHGPCGCASATLLLMLLLRWTSSSSSSSTGVIAVAEASEAAAAASAVSENDPKEAEATTTAPLSCPVGFGGRGTPGSDGAGTMMTIEPRMINDNYCDCPTTGIDEPLTGACSGHSNWSGLGSIAHDRDDSEDNHDEEPSSTYVCPQQPSKVLSASKLDDGICDCCCGSDETRSAGRAECPDVCDQVLAEERKRIKELRSNYQRGKQLRLKRLLEFEQKKEEVQKQLDEKHVEVARVHEQRVAAKEHVRQAKVGLFHSRLRRLREAAAEAVLAVGVGAASTTSVLSGMFHPLSTSELLNFIVHACQVAGEIADEHNGDTAKTCLPLRLAGLDAGIVWKHSSYEVARIQGDDDGAGGGGGGGLDAGVLAEMLHWNVRDPSHIVYNEHGLKKRAPPEASGASSSAAPSTNHRRKNRPNRRRKPPRDDGDDEDEYLMASGDDEDFDENQFDEDDDVVAGDRYGSTNAKATKPPKSSSDDDDDNDGETSDEARKERKKGRKAESERFHSELRERPLGKVQSAFLESSQSLLDRMDRILDDLKRQDEEEKKLERQQRRKDMERRRKERAKKNGGDGDSNDSEDDDPDAETAPNDEIGNEEEAAEAQVTDSQVEKLPENFDPIALPLARDALARRQSLVQRGYQYAVSAKILLDALLESHNKNDEDDSVRESRIRRDLSMLAVGTLAHGRLSAVHAWQIYQGVVDGLLVDEPAAATQEGSGEDDQTCKSPWTALCPPRSIERIVQRQKEDVAVNLPPEAIHRAAAAFCDEQMALLASNAESCLSTAVAAAELPIPSSIPDGYLGYVTPKPRKDDDLLAVALAALDLSYSDDVRTALDVQVEREKQLESDQNRVQDDIRDLTDSIGLDDPSKYGDNGELYALKDECFSYDTGKYVYEICLFGGSKQKEGKNSGGTDLGRWTGTSVDEEAGRRLWRWENGQRCWNGPNRSATAHVTCGAATRVVSVEEPEMCTYVLEVESYIACDDAFAAANGLESA